MNAAQYAAELLAIIDGDTGQESDEIDHLMATARREGVSDEAISEAVADLLAPPPPPSSMHWQPASTLDRIGQALRNHP